MNELIEKAKNGDQEAMETVIKENDGLIRHMMKAHGIPTTDEDFHSIGMFSLFKAIRTFNPEKGYAFSSYAGMVIGNDIKMEFRRQNSSKGLAMKDYVSFETEIGENITVQDVLRDDYALRELLMAGEEKVEDHLDTLTELELEIYHCRFIEDMSQKDIIKHLGVNWSQSYMARKISNIKAKIALELGIEYDGFSNIKNLKKKKKKEK